MNLVLRTDAGPQIGLGHAMRCLALAQAWRDRGGAVSLLQARPLPPAVARRYAAEGIAESEVAADRGSAEDAAAVTAAAAELAAPVVVDGYAFGPTYQARLHRRVRALLVVDDDGRTAPHHADLLLDPNPGARYPSLSADCRPLLGTDYALLRREMRRDGEPPPVPEEVARVLVLAGGSDPLDLTPLMLDAVAEALGPGPRVTVVAGPSHPGPAALMERLEKCGLMGEVAVDPPDLPARMATTDLAVSAAGSTCWELAHLGVPAVILAAVDNQRAVAGVLDHRGAAVDALPGATAETVGRQELARRLAAEVARLAAAPARRRAMAEAGRSLVDGRGAERAVAALLERAREAA